MKALENLRKVVKKHKNVKIKHLELSQLESEKSV